MKDLIRNYLEMASCGKLLSFYHVTGSSLKVDTNQTAKPNLLIPSFYFSDCVNRELIDWI